jgi:hypothetical protein
MIVVGLSACRHFSMVGEHRLCTLIRPPSRVLALHRLGTHSMKRVLCQATSYGTVLYCTVLYWYMVLPLRSVSPLCSVSLLCSVSTFFFFFFWFFRKYGAWHSRIDENQKKKVRPYQHRCLTWLFTDPKVDFSSFESTEQLFHDLK